MPKALSEPSLAGIPFDLGTAAVFAIIGWVCFRMGFRAQLAARRDHFEVVNLLTVERIPYHDVADVHIDQLSVRITLTSGRRVRAWGLADSLLNTGGSERQNLADRLRLIAAERQTGAAPRRTRSRLPDRWAPVALFALFSGAIVLRLVTQ
ncbi:PH domain-containing protein [Micromonospora sp. NBS 11-29]|uniref:PH domain-containing protein n=1 Tax=Micromonospora sp. NBS 11-29 TaxID=1960879 RepID=UPI00112229D7|nr:hypothetical protein [Micromonospora sp. NBS 11-29]